jgi:hypothetical protein
MPELFGTSPSVVYPTRRVQGIGCRVCLNLAHHTANRLKHPACDLNRIAELAQRAKTAKTCKAQECWRRKAIAAAAEYSKRGQARAKRCGAIMDAFEA